MRLRTIGLISTLALGLLAGPSDGRNSIKRRQIMSKKTHVILFAAIITSFLWSSAAEAQRRRPQFPDMTFFITSKSGPDGANFGGLEGADKY